MVLDVLGSSGPPTTALSVDPAGNIGIGAPEARRKLHVEGSEIHSGGGSGGFSFADRSSGSFVETPAAGERWVWYAQDGTARLRSGADHLAVAANGNIGVGINAQEAQRILHVEGSEIHSGGGAGGFSFADRTTGSFVESPTAGQRWVWYAQAAPPGSGRAPTASPSVPPAKAAASMSPGACGYGRETTVLRASGSFRPRQETTVPSSACQTKLTSGSGETPARAGASK